MTNVRLYQSAIGDAPVTPPVATGNTKIRLYRSTIGANTTSAAPSVTMPASITVEAGATIDITASDSGQVTSREWKLNGTVVGTSANLKVNALLPLTDTTYTYSYTVINSEGLTATGNVTVTVRQALNWTIDGNRAKVPYVFRTYTQAELDAIRNPAIEPDPVTTDPDPEVVSTNDVRVPIATNTPNYPAGTSNFNVNPDRTTL